MTRRSSQERPVKLAGAGKRSTSARSSSSPVWGWCSRASVCSVHMQPPYCLPAACHVGQLNVEKKRQRTARRGSGNGLPALSSPPKVASARALLISERTHADAGNLCRHAC